MTNFFILLLICAYGTHRYQSDAEVLQQSFLDVILILTANYFHYVSKTVL